MTPTIDEAEFVLCLTHDVDRPYKRLHQALYYGVAGKLDLGYHVRSALDRSRPYAHFETIRQLEADLGVRSAFYVLNQPSPIALSRPSTWSDPDSWIEHLGRYDPTRSEIVEAVRTLYDGDWEIGLHGSLATADDRERLTHEKAVLEDVLDAPIVGGRQHHLECTVPTTWTHQRAVGLSYDSSLGSSSSVGFDFGYRPLRPFDDAFVVFPLTVMDVALPDPGDHFDEAWNQCERLLLEAHDNGAVMTVCWHPMYYNRSEFPGYRRLYRRLIERALELDGWVGPPRDYYHHLQAPEHRPEQTTSTIPLRAIEQH